jgi:hypothetical protein
VYSFTQCPNTYIESARAFKDPAKCTRGEECPYAHTINEVFYHKDYYQSVPCGKATCRERYCPFSHETVSSSRPVVEQPSAPAPVSISKSENDLLPAIPSDTSKPQHEYGVYTYVNGSRYEGDWVGDFLEGMAWRCGRMGTDTKDITTEGRNLE